MTRSSSLKHSGFTGLTSLTYRSRAVGPMSVDALQRLERSAQARNRSAGLTGLAVYDDGRFFQWLEGPTEALTRVWESIRQDRRHTDITEVTVRSTPTRMFDGSDMSLAIQGEPSLQRRRPSPAVLSLVGKLDPLLAIGNTEGDVSEGEPPVQFGKDATAEPIIPFLPVLVEALLVPQALVKHGTRRRFLPRVSPLVGRLSRLLLEEDAGLATTMLGQLFVKAGSLAVLCATVIEPAARSLGDLWLADDCSQVAMTMAICRLQSIVRELPAEASPAAKGLAVVLVVPQPGEVHLISASLDAELLFQGGWDTHHAFPQTDDALRALVSENWFDVLDLSLSPALQRIDALPLMAETISAARAASMNPGLAVVVGGRAFFEECERSVMVGADASTISALHVVLTATAARHVTLTKLAERRVLVTSS